MTYLELCVLLRQEVGVAGTGPTTVTNQTGELKRLVTWIAQAWTEIQNKKNNWRWMRSSFTLATVAADGSYAYTDCTDTLTVAAIARFARWYPYNFRIYLTSTGVAGETRLNFCPWESFRDVWLMGTQTDGFPSDISIDPQDNLRLGAVPDAIYTVTGDYQRGAQTLAVDADTPDMPARFHTLIMHEAAKKYAAYHSAPEVWAQANDQAKGYWTDLYVDQLPRGGFGDPLC